MNIYAAYYDEPNKHTILKFPLISYLKIWYIQGYIITYTIDHDSVFSNWSRSDHNNRR